MCSQFVDSSGRILYNTNPIALGWSPRFALFLRTILFWFFLVCLFVFCLLVLFLFVCLCCLFVFCFFLFLFDPMEKFWEKCIWNLAFRGVSIITIRPRSHSTCIRYTVFAIRYTFCSPPQTRFRYFHATSLECRLWRRANRIAYSEYRIAYTSMWTRPKAFWYSLRLN